MQMEMSSGEYAWIANKEIGNLVILNSFGIWKYEGFFSVFNQLYS